MVYTKITFRVSYIDFLKGLRDSENFRNDFIQTLRNKVQFKSCYLEFPKFSRETMNSPAEFVVIETDQFPRSNCSQFRDKFIARNGKYLPYDEVVAFKNISGDAILITPVPYDDERDIHLNHLMAFIRYGEHDQIHNFLEAIGRETLNLQNVYLSTHGRGVPWLHFRICTSPKYYSFDGYAR